MRGLNRVLYVFALALLTACGGGGDGSTPGSSGSTSSAVTNDSITTLKSMATVKTLDAEPFPAMFRARANASIPELARLVSQGSAAVDSILVEFQRSPTVTDDVSLSLLAYALEKIGDRRAVPVLASWLDTNMLTGSTGWTTDFVTHTIKVLAGQPRINSTTFEYSIDEKFDTLLQAKGRTIASTPPAAGTATPNPVVRGVLDNVLSVQQRNACPRKIHVTGINAAGQEVTLGMNYRTVNNDLNRVINDSSYTDKDRADARVRLADWISTDETIHRGGNYAIEPNSVVTDASNCGGGVIEKVVNQLTGLLGIPINLGRGSSTAVEIRDVAKTFGNEVSLKDIDPLTVIVYEQKTDGYIPHVEIPLSVNRTATGGTAVIQSKYNNGHTRTHTVNLSGTNDEAFRTILSFVGGHPFFISNSGFNVKFYKIDPNRIKRVVVDSRFCACNPDDPTNIPVRIGQPTLNETSARVVTIEGSAGSGGLEIVSGATLMVNDTPQNLTFANGSFQAQVVLRSGDNTIKVIVDGVNGKRGCAIKKIKSTTAKTSLSATLTWLLDNADLDLYVTQPDGETAWYRSKVTTARGTLDVDNTRGFGPENYYISVPADSPLRNGRFSIRVHYFSDRQASSTAPARPAPWRVVVLTNEGAANETYQVYNGTLSAANSNNEAPTASGADWAVAQAVTLPPASTP